MYLQDIIDNANMLFFKNYIGTKTYNQLLHIIQIDLPKDRKAHTIHPPPCTDTFYAKRCCRQELGRHITSKYLWSSDNVPARLSGLLYQKHIPATGPEK
jgi:hypothetical protein